MIINKGSSSFPENLESSSSLSSFQARRLRKTLGGGMRQVGIICAAALVALQENIAKLEGDHKKAKILAGNFYFLWVFGFKCYFFGWKK